MHTAYYAGTYLVFVADKAATASKAAPIVPMLPTAKVLAQGDEEEPPVTGGGSVAGEPEGEEGPETLMAKQELSLIPSRSSSSSAASSPAAGSSQP